MLYPVYAQYEEGIVNHDTEWDNRSCAVDLDSEGVPIVIWLEETSSGRHVKYSRWEDEWIEESEISPGVSLYKYWPSIGNFDEGEVSAVWVEPYSSKLQIYYSEWEENDWSAYERPTEIYSVDHYEPDISIDNSGRPWIVWSQVSAQTGLFDIYAITKDSLGWTERMRVEFDSDIVDWYPSVASSPDGTMWIVWQRYDGVEDQDICFTIFKDMEIQQTGYITNTPGIYEQFSQINIGSDGMPWVVWQESEQGEAERRVMSARWVDNQWNDMGLVSGTPDLFNIKPNIHSGPDAMPWVTWWSGDGEIRINHWDGFEWRVPLIITAPDNAIDEYSDLVVDNNGVVWVVWEGGADWGRDIFYGRYDPSGSESISPSNVQLVCNPFPNPSSSVVTFPLESDLSANVQLRIYDIGGHLIRKLHSNSANGSNDYLIWDGLDHKRMRVSPGTYLCALSSGDQRVVRRVVVNR